jgi:AcrR family transcriptional regulator
MNNRIAMRQQARRRKVLDAAVEVFSRQGYRATSMQDIASKVGVGKASLYHYVSSKEELLIELYEEVLRENVAIARSAARSSVSPLEALEDILAQHISYACRNQRLLQVFFTQEAELPSKHRARLIAMRNEYEQTTAEIVREAIAQGQIELPTSVTIFLNTTLGAANWVYKWYDPKGSLNPEELGRQMSNLLLSGLVVPAARQAIAEPRLAPAPAPAPAEG